jgi:hypothetical protein
MKTSTSVEQYAGSLITSGNEASEVFHSTNLFV